ncbi:hypothetical protein LFM09_06580 [Lentzea alba]|uniref:hypothetical protein n=1 Tax=Lentzea alba TaxID=2714351 RepID=UPI0039BF3341
MKFLSSQRVRIALLVLSIVVIAVAIVFFVNQDLGSADQYASVASFFVGLAGLAVAVWSLVTARQPGSTVTFGHADVVQTERNAIANYQKTVNLNGSEERRG